MAEAVHLVMSKNESSSQGTYFARVHEQGTSVALFHMSFNSEKGDRGKLIPEPQAMGRIYAIHSLLKCSLIYFQSLMS
jgi:hypothetical protein